MSLGSVVVSRGFLGSLTCFGRSLGLLWFHEGLGVSRTFWRVLGVLGTLGSVGVSGGFGWSFGFWRSLGDLGSL